MSKKPCWGINDAEGRPWEDGEGSPHYDTEAEAQSVIDDRELAGHVAVEESVPCFLLTCARCGYVLDEDWYTLHFPEGDEPQALDQAYDSEWWLTSVEMAGHEPVLVALCAGCPRPYAGDDDSAWENEGNNALFIPYVKSTEGANA